MTKIGDIVIYKEPDGIPSRYGMTTHPAIVNKVAGDMADLTVFFHGYTAEAVMEVRRGTTTTDNHCWWDRE